ncbi:hypothetical protein J010_03683 [Cryptococcus neoformans]|nr:hypothetical protein C355_03588 [Cryptococcus neoformans var. grubii Th84]OXH09642.1 hypothetical protein J010_03683 [Cryptococcus neoformans var. grubii]OXH30673.1 hypothetical protein J009_03699 [Cryptococcus neoformans var. grubii]OXH50576.1 hypothetical protein J004_03751 [Cryptococcus neoformans var. grubii]OXH51251.1 hypothetical protein J003_03686 [Cryptococcus neoformans var. grubii]
MLLDDRAQSGEEGVITPYLQEGRNYRTQGTITTSSLSINERVGLVEEVLRANDEANDDLEKLLQTAFGMGPNSRLLGRMINLLEAQRDEINEMKPYIECRPSPSLITLQQIYAKVDGEIKNVAALPDIVARDTLMTLVQVLQEGPDYLIDVCLISNIIWYTEIVDISYAASIQHVLDKAINQKSDLTIFRGAVESILAISAALSVDLLDDQMDFAYRNLGALLRQLELRVESSKKATTETIVVNNVVGSSATTGASTSTRPPLPGYPADTSILSSADLPPASSRHSSPNASEFKSIDVKELQTLFGTGVSTHTTPLLRLSSFNATPTGIAAKPTPAPSSPAVSLAGSDSSEEIWEYRGQFLTRSALDLVLRQETLAQADSSGQYAGEVSWDDLRCAWIPVWVKKLKLSDLVEGEIPDSSPAGFQERDTDAWGNKIGWYGPHKEMYYKEEPKWELKD